MMLGQAYVLGGMLLVYGILPLQLEELEAIDRSAEAFAERADVQALVKNNKPQLARVYPLVVRDYLNNAGRKEMLPEARPHQVRECAHHYEHIWLERRFIWPKEGDGTPDWSVIYVQALDHYLGFCLRRPWSQ